jgi:hypothetical protein
MDHFKVSKPFPNLPYHPFTNFSNPQQQAKIGLSVSIEANNEDLQEQQDMGGEQAAANIPF